MFFFINMDSIVGVKFGNRRIRAARLGDFLSLYHPHQNHDDGDDQQQVDETAHRVGRNQAEQPSDDQEQCKCVEHGGFRGKVVAR